jgi:hypothetical protein
MIFRIGRSSKDLFYNEITQLEERVNSRFLSQYLHKNTGIPQERIDEPIETGLEGRFQKVD